MCTTVNECLNKARRREPYSEMSSQTKKKAPDLEHLKYEYDNIIAENMIANVTQLYGDWFHRDPHHTPITPSTWPSLMLHLSHSPTTDYV